MNISRIKRLQKLVTSKNASGMLVTNHLNIFYLTGFTGISPEEREAVVFVDKNPSTGSGQGRAYLFVPRMYEAQAKSLESVKNKEVKLVVDFERSGLLLMFIKIMSEHPRGVPQAQHHPWGGKPKVLVEENDLRVSELEMLKKHFDGKLVRSGGIIEEMRIVKDEEEIENIRKAVEITDKTFLELVNFLKSTDYRKLSELDLVDKIRQIGRILGAEGFGFEPIVANGSGASMPHYVTSGKKLKEGPFLFDMGFKFKGYTADLTRTIYLGKATNKFVNIYEKVLEANKIGIEECREGLTAQDLYQKVNDYFEEQGVEKYFLHGLGHGVGLNIHEEPYLRPGHKRVLKKNKTVTIEPGLYFENEFGVRIEDLVLVTEKGCEVLSKLSPKELIEI